MNVTIASKNPVKISAVKDAFTRVFKNQSFDFKGVSAPSGVADQPMTNRETLLGAKNRATYCKSNFKDSSFWIGIEGGLTKEDSKLGAFAWVYITNESMVGTAKSGTFFLPNKIIELIETGKELGEADDIVFGESNSKQKGGAVGLLTNNEIGRKNLYEEAIVLALIPFINKHLYS